MTKRLSILVAVIVIGGLGGPAVWAATPLLHLIGPVGILRTGETVAVEVLLDSAGQEINAAEIHLQFDSKALRVEKVAREQSAFTLWPEEPRWDNESGEVTLIGGRPNGLVAVDGSVATVYFATLRSGAVSVSTQDSRMHLNDGEGTAVALGGKEFSLHIFDPLVEVIVLRSSTHPTAEQWSKTHAVEVAWDIVPGGLYSYVFSQDSQAVPDDVPETIVGKVRYADLRDGVYYFTIKAKVSNALAWSNVVQRRFLIDGTPPQPLELAEARPMSGIVLLTWQAVDAVSGVARSTLAVNGTDQGEVLSPLTLRPEWRGQKLTITVKDQAGNTTTGEWVFDQAQAASPGGWLWLVWLVPVLVAAIVAFFLLRKRV